MKMYSKWNTVDLHIHSKFSNNVKVNDYDGEEYTAKELFKKISVKEELGHIFSITDHNCINIDLYEEIGREIINYSNLGYVIGVELDINDSNIHTDVFHCLCFFDTYDLNLVKKAIDELFENKELSERNSKTIYPTVNKVFDVFHRNNIQDIILIPHFNNKNKGIPANNAVEHLNYLCFNAYEDSNNMKNIEKSLSIYLKNGFDNFPFAVFSDSHNMSIYPKDKNGNLCSTCYMLGNVKYPFNSIKTAFQESRMRISFDGVENMRKINNHQYYLSEINHDGKQLYLSPYQNTIIGRFGSGKSLLLEELKKGVAGLKTNDKYKEFYSPERILKIKFKDQLVDSIEEALTSNKNIKKYEFIQIEEFYFKNSLNDEESRNLFDRLNISYTAKDDYVFDFNVPLSSDFFDFRTCFNKVSKINNLNYERAFSTQEYYTVSYNKDNLNYDGFINRIDTIADGVNSITNLKLKDCIDLFSFNEKRQLKQTSTIFSEKRKILGLLKSACIENVIPKYLDEYSTKYINNNAKSSKDTFVKDLDDFCNNLKRLKKSCNDYEKIYNKELFDKLKQEDLEKIENTVYSISSKYDVESDFKDVINTIFKQPDRKTSLFKTFLAFVLNGKDQLLKNRSITELDNLLKKFEAGVNTNFIRSNVKYDLVSSDGSMLKKSAGEKSSKFIKLIFDLIEKDLNNGEGVLLILDQPEDNIDNKNVYKEISVRLKRLKINYSNFQSIIVTHNANVGIVADSENIIIAEEVLSSDNKKIFTYKNGCIEDKKYISKVCEILEGGVKAMEQRSVKYGINVIKKVDENGL